MAEAYPFYRRIGDYAIIGNCRTAALISREGSLDWLCLPRFDAPAVFARLLDVRRGGRFLVCPVGPFSTSRRYLEDTNVLETTFTTAGGSLRLTDFMPVASEEEKERIPWPDHQILRLLECLEGEVEVEVICEPRPDFARAMPRVMDRGAFGFWFEHRDLQLILLADLPLQRLPDGGGAGGRSILRRGDRRALSLVSAHGEPAIVPPLGATADDFLARSVRWWRDWAANCRYRGRYRETVVRSALALKLLTYAPSGAVIAAATTSLPEAIGGKRNYDYRYCWLRDASWTLRSLYDLGYRAEAEAFLNWLLYATRLTWPRLQTVYSVHGEARLPERNLSHLEGYRGSQPVREGNRAWRQFQLDIYGELIAAAYEFVRRGGNLDRGEAKMLAGLGRTVCRCWREPDKGIWEMPGKPRQFTYSKVMSWVALDLLLQLDKNFPMNIPVEEFTRTREAIREEIENRGFNPRLSSYVGSFGEDEMDAALLQTPLVGYLQADNERMRSTFEQICRRLGRNGFLKRYASAFDELPSVEGAFGICNFWRVKYLVRLGRREEAREEFERYLGMGNDLGLFSEEFDPETWEMRGNLPQAFTHVGLISAALELEGETEP